MDYHEAIPYQKGKLDMLMAKIDLDKKLKDLLWAQLTGKYFKFDILAFAMQTVEDVQKAHVITVFEQESKLKHVQPYLA